MDFEEMNSVLLVDEMTTLKRLETAEDVVEALWRGTITPYEVINEYDDEELEYIYGDVCAGLEDIEEGDFWIVGVFTPQEIADGLLRLQDATERVCQENIRRTELKIKVIEEMTKAKQKR